MLNNIVLHFHICNTLKCLGWRKKKVLGCGTLASAAAKFPSVISNINFSLRQTAKNNQSSEVRLTKNRSEISVRLLLVLEYSHEPPPVPLHVMCCFSYRFVTFPSTTTVSSI